MKNLINLNLDRRLNKINGKKSKFYKIVSWVLIFSILNLVTGCMFYFKVTNPTGPVDETISNLSKQNKKIVVHLDDLAWVLKSPEISDNQLRGNIEEEFKSVLKNPVKSGGANRYSNVKSDNQSEVLNEVHVYIREMDKKPDSNVSIPLSSIEKVDVYEKDKEATIGSWTLGCIGGSIVGSAVILLIWILTKSSCPFIYVGDGENYALVGEIFSGSVQKAIERHDYLKLPVLNAGNTDYKLKITNEVKEIQNTNLMELWVFDHSGNMEIGVDKYGKYHSLENVKSPVTASNFAGDDVTGYIKSKDSLFYSGMEISADLPLTDGMVLEFDNPQISDTAKLVIRAKNSVLLDYMIGQFYDMFGVAFKSYMKKQAKATPEMLAQWFHKQNLYLALSVERNGAWEKVDYFNLAGPVAMRDDILAIPLNGTESNPLKVKLEYGNYFWELDYAGIDFTKDKKLEYQVIKPTLAINNRGENITGDISENDSKYYIQPNVGDYSDVTYKLSEFSGERQTVYLHSKGWYKILKNPSGKPKIKQLEAFRQPGYFNRFVNDYISSVASQK